jgi:hypothetical protein
VNALAKELEIGEADLGSRRAAHFLAAR